jgi:hypothetical protein
MADGTGISKEDAKKIAEELAKLTKGGGTSGADAAAKATGLFKEQVDKATSSFNPFSMAMGAAGKATDILSRAASNLESMIKPNLDMFRDLSKSGVSFSNDIAGMVIAQKGMRLEADEFAEIMKTNNSRFIAFGGNVTRGAESFAKLSEEFMASEYVDGLRQAGFTNKELNEVLVMQMRTRKFSEKDDAESRKAAIESAARLATEMDLQAKLTGKSREEQMATMKKAREDMAIEAKLRQMAAERGISTEEMRQQYSEQYNAAVLAGVETSFRESVLYGTARSKEAAMEQFGAGQATFKSSIEAGRKFVEGDLKATSEALKRAQAEGVEYQRSAQAQQIAMIPNATNPVVQATHKVMKQTMGTFDSFDAISQRADMRGKSIEEQAKFREEEARRAQQGVNELGVEASGASKALINFTGRVGDYEAALYKNVGTFVNERLGPGLGQLADTKLSATISKPGQKDTTVSRELDVTLQKGLRGPTEEEKAKAEEMRRRNPNVAFGDRLSGATERSPVLGGEFLRDAASSIKTGTDMLVQGLGTLNFAQEKPSLYGGTPGFFNEIVHDFGAETTALLHGKKAVLNEKQLLDMAKGINTSAFAESLGALKTVTVSNNTASDVSMNPRSMMGSLQNMDLEQKFRSMTTDLSKNPDIKTAMQTGQSISKTESVNTDLMGKRETKATLDDVVGSLNSLNNRMERLLTTHEDIGNKQIRATKSNNSNIYARA